MDREIGTKQSSAEHVEAHVIVGELLFLDGAAAAVSSAAASTTGAAEAKADGSAKSALSCLTSGNSTAAKATRFIKPKPEAGADVLLGDVQDPGVEDRARIVDLEDVKSRNRRGGFSTW